MNRKCSFCFSFLKTSLRNWHQIFIKCLVEFTRKAFLHLKFSLWERFLSTNSTKRIYGNSAYVFLRELQKFVSLKEFVHFIQVNKFTSIKLFTILPYYIFNISHVSFLISDTDNQSNLSYFLSKSVQRFINFINLLKKSKLLFSLIFLFCFLLFYFIDFCIYLYYFLPPDNLEL